MARRWLSAEHHDEVGRTRTLVRSASKRTRQPVSEWPMPADGAADAAAMFSLERMVRQASASRGIRAIRLTCRMNDELAPKQRSSRWWKGQPERIRRFSRSSITHGAAHECSCFKMSEELKRQVSHGKSCPVDGGHGARFNTAAGN